MGLTMSKKYNGGSKSATQKTKKPAERSPAIQFYFKQFVGDENILCMDLDAVGAHILLMCYAGASEHQYKIRYQKDRIRKLIRCNDFDRFEIILAQLLEGAWKVSEDGEWLEQHGLKRSLLKQKEFSRLQSERIKARWDNTKRIPDVYRNDTEVVPEVYSSSSSSSTSSIDLITNVIRSTNTSSDVVCFEGGSGGTFVKPPAPVEEKNPDDVKVSGKLFPEIYLSANERKKIKANYANDGLGDEAVTLGLETLQHYAVNHSAKFKKYKSHYLVMIGWVKVEVKKKIKQDLDLERSQIYANKAQISQFTN